MTCREGCTWVYSPYLKTGPKGPVIERICSVCGRQEMVKGSVVEVGSLTGEFYGLLRKFNREELKTSEPVEGEERILPTDDQMDLTTDRKDNRKENANKIEDIFDIK